MTTTSRGASAGVTPSDLAFLLFLGAVWGGAFLFLRIAAPQIGPLWAAEVRIGLAALILIAVAGRPAWRALRGRLRAVVVVGVAFSAIPFSLIAFASLTLPAGFAALLNAATPISTALVSAVWLRSRLSTRALVGMAVGVAAVLVLVGWSPLPMGPATIVAVLAALAATVSYAIAGVWVRRRLPDVRGVDLAAGQLTSGALVLLPFAVLSGPPGPVALDGVVALIGVATVSTALAWPIFFRVAQRTTPTAASTVTFIVPAFGIAWGALFLSEPVGLELVAGFALVVVSLVLVLHLPMPSLARVRQSLGAASRPLGAPSVG